MDISIILKINKDQLNNFLWLSGILKTKINLSGIVLLVH